MSQTISVLTGEVNRTWRFVDPLGKNHEVSLYHHTWTGARGVMLDYLELPKSIGTTSLLTSQHTIWFDAGGGWRGGIIIKRKGVSTFEYECVVGGKVIPEALTSNQSSSLLGGAGTGGGGSDEPTFDLELGPCELATFGAGGAGDDSGAAVPLAWYPLTVTRKSDDVTTTVHRRFRDFAELDSAVRAALSGHHLASSLPHLPPKHSKLLHNHADPRFQEQRRQELELWVKKLVNVPYVLEVPMTLPFLGVAQRLRELSFVFPAKSIGITICRAPTHGSNSSKNAAQVRRHLDIGVDLGFPAMVEVVRGGPAVGILNPGDMVSKVNGISASTMTFPSLVTYIASSPRPLVVHFLQAVNQSGGADGDGGGGGGGSYSASSSSDSSSSSALGGSLPTTPSSPFSDHKPPAPPAAAATRASVLARMNAAKKSNSNNNRGDGISGATDNPFVQTVPPPVPTTTPAVAAAAAAEAAAPGEFDDAPEGEAGEFFV